MKVNSLRQRPCFQRLLKIAPSDQRSRVALGVALDGEGKASGKRSKGFVPGSQTIRERVTHASILPILNCAMSGSRVLSRTFVPRSAPALKTQMFALVLEWLWKVEIRETRRRLRFRRSIEIAPGNLRALLGSAEIKSESGDFESAIQILKQATSLHPDSAEAHEELARAYAQSGDQNSALAELKKAVQLGPNDPLLHAALSQVLASTGNVGQAIEEQRTALKLFDRDADGWNNLGVLESRTGQTAAARADFEHALRLQPDHPQARASRTSSPS